MLSKVGRGGWQQSVGGKGTSRAPLQSAEFQAASFLLPTRSAHHLGDRCPWRLLRTRPGPEISVRVWPKSTGGCSSLLSCSGLRSGALPTWVQACSAIRGQDSERRRREAMKGKGGAMDRRSSARWRVLLLCAFSFGLGMLFTDRWVWVSLYLFLRAKLWIPPCTSFCTWGSWGFRSSPGVMAVVHWKGRFLRPSSRFRFEVWISSWLSQWCFEICLEGGWIPSALIFFLLHFFFAMVFPSWSSWRSGWWTYPFLFLRRGRSRFDVDWWRRHLPVPVRAHGRLRGLVAPTADILNYWAKEARMDFTMFSKRVFIKRCLRFYENVNWG
jgi:hypothetical protein